MPKSSQVATAWGLTIAGIALPIALVAASAAATHTPWRLLAVAVILGIVGPSAGHVVLRRRILTRGHVVRICAAAAAGLLVLGAEGARDLGIALGMAAIAMAILLIGFAVGAATDVVDLGRAIRGER